jgi:hypothetical protein
MILCEKSATFRDHALTEGPFLNHHGHWQMNLYRHVAGEEIACVVAIEWVARVLVINAF